MRDSRPYEPQCARSTRTTSPFRRGVRTIDPSALAREPLDRCRHREFSIRLAARRHAAQRGRIAPTFDRSGVLTRCDLGSVSTLVPVLIAMSPESTGEEEPGGHLEAPPVEHILALRGRRFNPSNLTGHTGAECDGTASGRCSDRALIVPIRLTDHPRKDGVRRPSHVRLDF